MRFIIGSIVSFIGIGVYSFLKNEYLFLYYFLSLYVILSLIFHYTARIQILSYFGARRVYNTEKYKLLFNFLDINEKRSENDLRLYFYKGYYPSYFKLGKNDFLISDQLLIHFHKQTSPESLIKLSSAKSHLKNLDRKIQLWICVLLLNVKDIGVNFVKLFFPKSYELALIWLGDVLIFPFIEIQFFIWGKYQELDLKDNLEIGKIKYNLLLFLFSSEFSYPTKRLIFWLEAPKKEHLAYD